MLFLCFWVVWGFFYVQATEIWFVEDASSLSVQIRLVRYFLSWLLRWGNNWLHFFGWKFVGCESVEGRRLCILHFVLSKLR